MFTPSTTFFIFQKIRLVENIFLRSTIMTKATVICTGVKIPSGKINSRSYLPFRDASMMLHHNTLASHISSVRKSTMHLHDHLQWQNDALAFFCWYWRNCFVVVEKCNRTECVWWARVKRPKKSKWRKENNVQACSVSLGKGGKPDRPELEALKQRLWVSGAVHCYEIVSWTLGTL